ncbi:MAG: 4-hydroxy-tetrahydrodipicolinate synthase [Acidimicrobiales bacterium]|nr:MAG: 4-hydroxy-tetrahydrodipicolinate synthase [Acidimicrobiales bacterium]
MARFGQVLTAMVSPFTAGDQLDVDGAQELAKWLVANGNDGLVIAGTTGESPTLTHDEQIELIRAVVDAVDVPVIAGTGSNDTRAAVELTRRATEVGATGILSVTPYYNRPSQEGLVRHFEAVAAATDLPVMLYDIPVRTGRKIETENLVRLSRVDNIVALKDAAGNPAETAVVIAEAGPDFDVYSGDDSFTLPLLAVGAVGVVGVATHWCGVETKLMVQAHTAGNVAEATKINQGLLASWSYETGDLAPNPLPSKAMLRVLGLPGGACRPPMGPEPEWLADEARKVLSNLGRPGF